MHVKTCYDYFHRCVNKKLKNCLKNNILYKNLSELMIFVHMIFIHMIFVHIGSIESE